MPNFPRDQHPYTAMPRSFFEALDIPTLYPERWANCLTACGGDHEQAHGLAVDLLEFVHSPTHGPETRGQADKALAFKLAFGKAYGWDQRRFLRYMRKTLHGKRQALYYWRVMTKGVVP